MPLPTFAELETRFRAARAWEEKYRQLILLSRELPPMNDSDKAPENEVRGCENRVWLAITPREDGTFDVSGDSEGRIVKGLLAILIILANGQTAGHIRDIRFHDMFEKLGIEQQLSASRQDGLNALIARLQSIL